ncbi:hypothetical protein ACFL1B_05115 [Nanoarchaeota archaeon]
MARKVSIDTPLSEVTLRKYEKPRSLEKRELARKICLSLGLLQPGDSRDIIVDVFQVVVESGKELTSKQVETLTKENRKKYKLPLHGVAPSNIRRQLLRLRDLFLVEKVKNNYRIRENATLIHIFEENIQEYYLQSIISRVKEYLKAADREYFKK